MNNRLSDDREKLFCFLFAPGLDCRRLKKFSFKALTNGVAALVRVHKMKTLSNRVKLIK